MKLIASHEYNGTENEVNMMLKAFNLTGYFVSNQFLCMKFAVIKMKLLVSHKRNGTENEVKMISNTFTLTWAGAYYKRATHVLPSHARLLNDCWYDRSWEIKSES
ncbi:hypothetical protein AVEN_221288-1 [Araneus ventricosus]|uniref:Uncharacterized protein n=1 Tax=Araneus ventricosus TaxID=182803 RepID=A0A4Y2AYV3_ARAVE|nr:hypothetical protein AVEN_221288-1 [Araneus ventricosus]